MANSTSKAAENALRRLLKNMRNGVNHTQALANFKEAVQAYNRAQVRAVGAANKALENTTAQNVKGAAEALGNVLKMGENLTRAQSLVKVAAAAEAAGTPVNTVRIGKNNFTVIRNNNGEIVEVKGREGKYQFETQNKKNYIQLKNGAWYQLGNNSRQKYNKNKSSGKFVKKQGFLGRVGGLLRRRSVRVNPSNETPLLSPNK